jgi:hypothetical protein
MLYGGGNHTNQDSRITMRSHDDNNHPTPFQTKKNTVVVLTESPPSDSSPRLVRRLPSDDGGMDDLHRMMMASEKLSEDHDISPSSSNGLLKRYAALPRRPQRPSTRRRDDGITTTTLGIESDHDTDDSDHHNTNNNDVPTMTTVVPKKGCVDLSPRKPARRLVSTATTLSPLLSPSKERSEDPSSPSPLSIYNRYNDEAHDSPHHHHHHHHRVIRSPTTHRHTVRSNHHHHHHNKNNNHRTVKYLVEALTIVNLCDIENDISSFHQNDHHNHAADTDGTAPRQHPHRARQPSNWTMASGNSSSDESTVESIPSMDDVPNHKDPVCAPNPQPPSREVSSSSRFPQAA